MRHHFRLFWMQDQPPCFRSILEVNEHVLQLCSRGGEEHHIIGEAEATQVAVRTDAHFETILLLLPFVAKVSEAAFKYCVEQQR